MGRLRLALVLLLAAAPLRAATLVPGAGGAPFARLYAPAPPEFVEVLTRLPDGFIAPPVLARLGADPDLLGPFVAHLRRDYPEAQALKADMLSADPGSRELASTALALAEQGSLEALVQQGWTLGGEAQAAAGELTTVDGGVKLAARLQEMDGYLEAYIPPDDQPVGPRGLVEDGLRRARGRAIEMIRALREGGPAAPPAAALPGTQDEREAVRRAALEFLEEEHPTQGWRAREILAAYARLGFVRDRQKGSHVILKHPLFPDLHVLVESHPGELPENYFPDLRARARALAERLAPRPAVARLDASTDRELDAFIEAFLKARPEARLEPPAPMEAVPEGGLAPLGTPREELPATAEAGPPPEPVVETAIVRRARAVIVLDNLGIEELDELSRILDREALVPTYRGGGTVFDEAMIRGTDWALRSIAVFGPQTPSVERALREASGRGVTVFRWPRPKLRPERLPDLVLDGAVAVQRAREEEPPYPGARPREYVIVTDSPDYLKAAEEQVARPAASAWRALRESGERLRRSIRRRLFGPEIVTVADVSGSLLFSEEKGPEGTGETPERRSLPSSRPSSRPARPGSSR